MFEILQYICGYNSDKMAKGKKRNKKNKYISTDWYVVSWVLRYFKLHLILIIFAFRNRFYLEKVCDSFVFTEWLYQTHTACYSPVSSDSLLWSFVIK